MRSDFKQVIEQTTQSAIEVGHFDRGGKNPGQAIIRGFIILFTRLVRNSKHAKDITQAIRDFMANLHQLELDKRHCVELPLLAHPIPCVFPFEKYQTIPVDAFHHRGFRCF